MGSTGSSSQFFSGRIAPIPFTDGRKHGDRPRVGLLLDSSQAVEGVFGAQARPLQENVGDVHRGPEDGTVGGY